MEWLCGPENVQVIAPGSATVGNAQSWTGTVKRIVFAGASDLIEVDCSDGVVLNARVPSGGSYPPTVQLVVSAEHLIPLS